MGAIMQATDNQPLNGVGRPSFIPREMFRQWMKTSGLNKLLSVDGIAAASYVARCERAGRPIKGCQGRFRPIDLVARARAEALEIRPPKAQKQQETVANLEAKIANLEYEYRKLQAKVSHRIEMNHLSEGLTNKTLLTEREVVEGSQPQPHLTGVYFLVKGQRVVYVGQSVNVLSRIATHRQNKEFDRFTFVPCMREELDVFESIYIHCFRPVLNGRLRGKGDFHAPLSLRGIVSLHANHKDANLHRGVAS